jgi:hypothetical protein
MHRAVIFSTQMKVSWTTQKHLLLLKLCMSKKLIQIFFLVTSEITVTLMHEHPKLNNLVRQVWTLFIHLMHSYHI